MSVTAGGKRVHWCVINDSTFHLKYPLVFSQFCILQIGDFIMFTLIILNFEHEHSLIKSPYHHADGLHGNVPAAFIQVPSYSIFVKLCFVAPSFHIVTIRSRVRACQVPEWSVPPCTVPSRGIQVFVTRREICSIWKSHWVTYSKYPYMVTMEKGLMRNTSNVQYFIIWSSKNWNNRGKFPHPHLFDLLLFIRYMTKHLTSRLNSLYTLYSWRWILLQILC